ncbi:MAG TPA: aminoacyl-tRNA hydrolase [Candidatus Tyrphobacter sp.]
MRPRVPPRIVVGLGNPGREYERTRHNLGFMVVDEIGTRLGVEKWKRKDSARQTYDASRGVVLVEPTSFMNLSGAPVRLISSWYRTPPEGVLVVADDIDLPFGTLRARAFGGHGGHNGLRSVIATIGEGFPRLRIGVGRPKDDDAVDHVLAPFDASERAALPAIIGAAADAVQLWLGDGIDAAMRFANTWPQG